MLKNYFKIAIRNLLRQKAFSFINIAGLATGMACSILILLWVQDELSYDRFHEHSNRIYRITTETQGFHAASTNAPLPAAMQAQMPEVKNAARLLRNDRSETLLTVGERTFEEKAVFYADSTFLQMFSFPLLHGDRRTALSRPDGLLLTERTARKYFGTADALGRTIRMDHQHDFLVVGVLRDIPANSHLQFDVILPMSFRARTDKNLIDNYWYNYNFFGYVQLDPGVKTSPASLMALEKRMNDIFKKNAPDTEATMHLQPLPEIHLRSSFIADVEGHGNPQYVRIFAVVAVFVLLVACINFMNLATARSARRAKEVGLRKVIGANRKQLIGQFLGESLLLTFVSMLLAVVLVQAVLPAFNGLSGKALTLSLTDTKLFGGLLLLFLVTSLVSGSYPAFFLSAFQPVKVLKGGVTKVGSGTVFFRNGLVVVQFVVSIVLIVGTAVVYNQLQHIKTINLGYDKANLLYLPLKGDLPGSLPVFRTELERNPALNDYTAVSHLPSSLTGSTMAVEWEGKDPEVQQQIPVLGVDESFLEVFRIQLPAGRNFAKNAKADTASFIVNEKALQVMGIKTESAVGKPFTLWGTKGRIIGVVKDFNFKPIHQPIEPIILWFSPSNLWYKPAYGYMVVRTKPGQTEAAIAGAKQIWQKLNPTYTFDYGFLDQDLDRLYRAEQRMGRIFNAFALLAIFISCLGLYGLAAFTAEQRTKEIGIRKVLGASVSSVVSLLSKDFLKLVLLANILAWPLAGYVMHQWLQNFAYRIDLSWGIFALAGVAALLIALFTVSFQAIKAAVANPVKSLRSE